MIIIRMSGGLERQMFQYALYMKLTAMGREVKFDDINEYRDEKAKPIMLSVFGLAGFLILGAAYYIAVTIKQPLTALAVFFIAVLMKSEAKRS